MNCASCDSYAARDGTSNLPASRPAYRRASGSEENARTGDYIRLTSFCGNFMEKFGRGIGCERDKANPNP